MFIITLVIDGCMSWSLETKDGRALQPLTFSSGKTQEDLVQDVLNAVRGGHRVIFLKGVCGSGKSAIALNVAKELGRASIVVPVKYLQQQYARDYTDTLLVKKRDGTPLRITILTGRNNHPCLYQPSVMADDRFLPCDIEIKQENLDLLKLYARNNPLVDEDDFDIIDDFKRLSVAPACPYWSPILANEWVRGEKVLPDAEMSEYLGLRKKMFTIYQREPGCTYYEQFFAYKHADVIVFNSKKYELEVAMDRKPATDIEIIDECDEFLDNLGNEKRMNLTWVEKRLREWIGQCKEESMKESLAKLHEMVASLLRSKWLEEVIDHREILKIKETKLTDILRMILDHEELLMYEDLEPYYFIARHFEQYLDDTYTMFERTPHDHVVANVVNTNLQKRMSDLLEKNKVFLMMSGTIHSATVLKKIFGISDFVVIDAETASQGKATALRTGKEVNCRYKEFAEGRVTREDYLRALELTLVAAKRPTLVHVHGFKDLPSEEEKESYHLSIMSREKLQEQQETYRKGELLEWFKEGKLDILYSTKCTRGVDLPGEQCNSIVLTKYPYPAAESLFWRVLKRSKSEHYMDFYLDKSYREFLQRVYRGLRSKDDRVFILSPDLKVVTTPVR